MISNTADNPYTLEAGTKPVILVDCDGILSNLGKRWHEDYCREWEDSITLEQFHAHWDVHQNVKPECGTKIYDFLHRPDYYYELEPIEGSQEGLRYLSEFVEPVIVSQTNATQVGARIRWIKEHYPFVKPGNIILTSRKDLIRGALLIDDAPHNVQHDRPYFILMDYPYNKGLEGFMYHEILDYAGAWDHPRIRVCSWWDLTDAVMHLYKMGRLQGQAEAVV